MKPIFLSVMLMGCGNTLAASALAEGALAETTLTKSNHDARTIWVMQNGVKQAFAQGLSNPTQITLGGGSFVINAGQVPNDIAIRICATINPALMLNIAKTTLTDPGNCYEEGTGLAVDAPKHPTDGLTLMVVADTGHNYFGDERRVTEDGAATIYINDISYIGDIANEPPWVVVYIPTNDNNTPEEHELWSAKVVWR